MRIVNTDAKSHSAKTPEKCLQEADQAKKKMYLEACLQQRRHFSPFVPSADGLLGVEATATLKRISSRLAKKWQQPYSRTCRYVKNRVAITLVQATHQCIRGSRVPGHNISVHRPQWEDGAGTNLFRYARREILRPDDVLAPPQPLSHPSADRPSRHMDLHGTIG